MWSWILDNEEVLAHWGTFCHRGVKIHMLRFWEISQSTRFDMSAFRLLWNLTESGWYMPFEFDVCMTVHQWYNNKISQIDTTVIILLTISISSTCFGPQFRPFSGAQDCVYRLFYNVLAMLPAGHQQAASSVHYKRFWSLWFYTYEFVECNSGVNVALGSWRLKISKLGPIRKHILILSRDLNTLATECKYSEHAFLSDNPPDSR